MIKHQLDKGGSVTGMSGSCSVRSMAIQDVTAVSETAIHPVSMDISIDVQV